MITRSAERVIAFTKPEDQEKIDRATEVRLDFFAKHPDLIEERLEELDEEWDIERALGLLSSGLSLASIFLSLTGKRRWLLAALGIQGFFMQHAIQGWCPPLTLLRRIGIRTAAEIEDERHELEHMLERSMEDDTTIVSEESGEDVPLAEESPEARS